MNEKFLFNHSKLATGPVYSWSDYADPSLQPLKFSPKRARKILEQAGWKDSNKDGILDKTLQGKLRSLSFTLTFSSKDSEKYLTIFQEDLKKEGIQLKLKRIDWTSFVRSLQEKNFDAIMLSWSGGSIDWDPKQIWHTESARKGGSNFISYSRPQVDRLIDKGRKELNRKKRIQIFRQVYRKIAQDVPYIFLFNNPYYFYGLNIRILAPKPTFNYFIGDAYWKLKAGF